MKRFFGIMLCLGAVTAIYGQTASDSASLRERFIRSNEFFDGLQERLRKSKLTDFIINSIVINNDWKGENARRVAKQLTDETLYFSEFEGKEIATVNVLTKNVYNDTLHSFFPRMVNAMHITTREKTIRQNLLFKAGEMVDAATMIRNEELLRRLGSFADAYIIVAPNPNDSSAVDVFVHTRDRWNINFELEKKSDEEFNLSLYDRNFLGEGHYLSIGSNIRIENPEKPNPHTSGFSVDYNVQNMGGSFFNGDFQIDRSYNHNMYLLQAKKPFIKSSDYAVNTMYRRNEGFEHQVLTDTSYKVKRQIWDVSAGLSQQLPARKNNIYLMARVLATQILDYGGAVSEMLNPYYQSRIVALASAGIYRESFYRGSHIYSFGVSEDIPHGYRFEITAGRSWDRYRKRDYFAAEWNGGLRLKIGYLRQSVVYGSYFLNDFEPQQSTLAVKTGFFTNLFPLGKGYMRYFINTNYSAGFNRMEGERERITFRDLNSLRILNLPLQYNGLSRLICRTEGVYFSPFYFYNFRLAFYGFCDFGWLNDRYHFSTDNFHTTLGMGIRISNDRLIFRSVQFQIGYIVVNPSHSVSQWFDVGKDQRIRPGRLLPDEPNVVSFW
ncbi:MAG: hypothetical protein LBS25_00580 [Candidatus Symbiothrix sp.]|jgi:hypothetical protein|nr:hypothetical protein [Candidatus Symbiothrix sp.]